MLRIQAETKGITLTYNISPTTPYELVGDPHHLRQVLINLIGNAIKFTEVGGVEVRVTTASESATTASIRFEVIDTGIGIPVEAQESIFESFTQADNTTTRQYGGTEPPASRYGYPVISQAFIDFCTGHRHPGSG